VPIGLHWKQRDDRRSENLLLSPGAGQPSMSRSAGKTGGAFSARMLIDAAGASVRRIDTTSREKMR
jgi:hypothetical protein